MQPFFWPKLLQLPFVESFSKPPNTIARQATSQSPSPQISVAPAPILACALTRGVGRGAVPDRAPARLPAHLALPNSSRGPTSTLWPRPFPPKLRKAYLKDLASAQSVHVRGHNEKDPLSGKERAS